MNGCVFRPLFKIHCAGVIDNARGDLIMKIGFIGLGHMGSGMAHNLLKAGHELTVYNRTPGKAQALFSHGARAATAVADACRGDAVITMLSNDTKMT